MTHLFAAIAVVKPFWIWSIGGTIGVLDLIAATTNAFNGALLARRPDHNKHYTLAGIMFLATAGGIGGGIARDVLLNVVPAPLMTPWYLLAASAAAGLAILIDWESGQRLRDGLFQFMTAFSLPWYAIVGASKAMSAHLPDIAALVIGIVATTFGRYIIDISCGVTPKQLVRGKFFIGSAALTAAVYIVARESALDTTVATALAFAIGFAFRLSAQTLGWEEYEPATPAGEKPEKPRKTLVQHIKEEIGPRGIPR